MQIFGLSDIGRERKSNQDAVYFENKPPKALLVLADGMGGHLAGDKASSLTIEGLKKSLESNITDPQNYFTQVIAKINQEIYDLGQQEDFKGMGTTLAMIYLDFPKIWGFHVGDSRIYLLTNQTLFQLTVDHTLTEQKASLGLIERKDTHEDPHRYILYKGLGLQPKIEVDFFTYDLKQGDLLLISSDGFHDFLIHEEISLLIKNHLNTEELVKKAIQVANEKSGADNISVLVLDNRH